MAYAAAAVRVLLVEPDADTRELYSLWLDRLGWQVIATADGATAAAVLLAHPPDVLVCELRLRDRGEVPLLALASSSGVPVVAMTTAPAHQQGFAVPSTVAALLRKPFEPDDVVRAIVSVTGPPLDGSPLTRLV